MASPRESLDGFGVTECIKALIVVHVVVSFALYIAALLFGDKLTGKMLTGCLRKRVLLITAHPDDECMFFSPYLLSATGETQRPDVHVLCLTNGNYYGQGKVREKEIMDSCDILGISPDHVSVINDSHLPDDPKAVWDAGQLESHMCAVISRIQPQQIVTFDDYGVSGHSNHITVSKAVRNIFQAGEKFKGVESVYYLESVSLWRKYLGILELPFTFLFSSHIYLLSPGQIFRAQRAMLSHRSQLEWFRFLYILLSRYMVVNSFYVEHQCVDEKIGR